MTSIDIVSIATNGYTKYWSEMITSFSEHNQLFDVVVVHVLTDDPLFVKSYSIRHPEIKFVAHKVESMPWPLPTLMRYTYISRIIDSLQTENFLYIDSDMKFHSGFDHDMKLAFSLHTISLVIHPGFWRNKSS